MERFDCIVVGSGPAGSTVARHCALNGLKTILIEKEVLPRYKPCGGAVPAAIKNILGFEYDMAVERSVKAITFISRSEPKHHTTYPENMEVGMVSRADFDYHLVKKAIQAGAVLMEKTRVTSVEESDGHVTVHTDRGYDIAGLIVIGADGARSTVARSTRLHGEPGGIGIEAELFPDDIHVLDRHSEKAVFGFGFIPKGYGWIFPKKDHFSVGIFTTLEHMSGMTSLYRQFLANIDFLENSREQVRRGWFIPFSKGPALLNTRRVCLTGDAARLADPFSGEGIYYAVLSGIIAADIICNELEQYGCLTKRYTKEINGIIVKDFTYARWCAEIFFLSPSFFYRKDSVIRTFSRLSGKKIRYRDILNELRRNGTHLPHLLSGIKGQ